jgi:transcriptional regulator with XRE-family HTH domain
MQTNLNLLKQSLGKRIRTARRSAGLTQEQLAERVGRSTEAISNIERGASLPALETLASVADALSVPLGFLIDDEDSTATPRRVEMETRLRLLFRDLPQRDAEIALQLVEVMYANREKA